MLFRTPTETSEVWVEMGSSINANRKGIQISAQKDPNMSDLIVVERPGFIP